MPVSDISIAERQPPHMGPVARGFAALGDMAERASALSPGSPPMRRRLRAVSVTPPPCSPATDNSAASGT